MIIFLKPSIAKHNMCSHFDLKLVTHELFTEVHISGILHNYEEKYMCEILNTKLS